MFLQEAEGRPSIVPNLLDGVEQLGQDDRHVAQRADFACREVHTRYTVREARAPHRYEQQQHSLSQPKHCQQYTVTCGIVHVDVPFRSTVELHHPLYVVPLLLYQHTGKYF